MIWEFPMPVFQEMDRQAATSLFERLSEDPHVAEVTLEDQPQNPYMALLRVTFVRGYSQPYDPDLRRLPFQHGHGVPLAPPGPASGPTAYDLMLDAPDEPDDRWPKDR